MVANKYTSSLKLEHYIHKVWKHYSQPSKELDSRSPDPQDTYLTYFTSLSRKVSTYAYD